VNSQPLQLSRKQKVGERERLVRRVKLLALLGVGWHGVEAAVAVGAGIVAGSIALVGFGADSLVESLAGIILLWRFAAARTSSEAAERRAQKLIGLSFYLIAAYVAFEAVRSLFVGAQPEASWIGIGLAALTLAIMPPLAIAKARVVEKLGWFFGNEERRPTEHALRLPLRGTSRWAGRQRALRPVVGRPSHRALHRRRRRQGGPRILAQRELLHDPPPPRR
jgi:hypothetical protein